MKISNTAQIDPNVTISNTAKIWDYAHIRSNALIGDNVIIGRGVYIGVGVIVSENCKVQNYSLIYEPARLERGVFIGPGTILTNDYLPRAVNPDFKIKKNEDWSSVGVHVNEGASIGAGSICLAPVIIGKWAMVGAGSIVTKNIPDFSLVVGSPARHIAWIGRSGKKLISGPEKNLYVCPDSNRIYKEISKNELLELDSIINK